MSTELELSVKVGEDKFEKSYEQIKYPFNYEKLKEAS